MSSETDSPCQSVAQHREPWHALEASLISRVARISPMHEEDVSRGRHALHDSAGLEGECAKCKDAHPEN